MPVGNAAVKLLISPQDTGPGLRSAGGELSTEGAAAPSSSGSRALGDPAGCSYSLRAGLICTFFSAATPAPGSGELVWVRERAPFSVSHCHTEFVVFWLLGHGAGVPSNTGWTAPPGCALTGGAPCLPLKPGNDEGPRGSIAALSVFTLSRRLCAIH